MTATENGAIISEFHEKLWNQGDLSVIDAVFRSDARVRMAGFAEHAAAVVRADAERYRAAFVQIRSTVLALVCEGDQVVLHWSTTGRHVGPYGRVAATGRDIVMTGIDIYRLSDSRVVECSSVWDGLEVFDQMGALPELW